jgi:hypothetical protein
MDFNAQYARGFDQDIDDPRLIWEPHQLNALVIEMATPKIGRQGSVPQSMAEGSSSSNHCKHFIESLQAFPIFCFARNARLISSR